MSSASNKSVFLARASYRQRRLRDVLRVLPLVGIVLWLLPLLWQGDDGAPSRTEAVLQYVFSAWILLIVIGAVLARWIKPETAAEPDEDLG